MSELILAGSIVAIALVGAVWAIYFDERAWRRGQLNELQAECAVCKQSGTPGASEDLLAGRPKVCAMCRGRVLGLLRPVLHDEVQGRVRQVLAREVKVKLNG